MSSFKIERQRVRLVQPETTIPTRDEKPVRPDEEEINRIYAEIFERLTREHQEQAERLLEEAGEKARRIIDEAREQAGEILAQAEEEARKFRREAEEEIFAKEEERRAAFERQCQEEARRNQEALRLLVEELQNRYKALVDEVREGAAALVMEIVRKVIQVKLSESDEVFMSLIRDAIERLRSQGAATIRVSPEDYARYFGQKPGWQDRLETGDLKLSAVPDSSFTPGDLVVDTEFECVDMSVSRQLREIEKALSE